MMQGGLQCPGIFFEWKQQRNLPHSLACSHPVILDAKVYIRCGSSMVLEYTPEEDTWLTLPQPLVKGFCMTALNGHIVLVGGEIIGYDRITDIITVWDSQSKQWTHPYPPMPTARREAGCASYKHYLIVAGGDTPVKLNSTDTVEILDTNAHKWYKAPSLPYNGSRITSVTIEEYLYLLPAYCGVMTEARTLYRSSLPNLVACTVAKHHNGTCSTWEKLPDVPLIFMSMFSICNMLLIAGGGQGGLGIMSFLSNKPCNDIYVFNPYISQWVKVDKLPHPRALCSCIFLPSKQLLLAGGTSTHTKDGQSSNMVYTATIARYF